MKAQRDAHVKGDAQPEFSLNEIEEVVERLAKLCFGSVVFAAYG